LKLPKYEKKNSKNNKIKINFKIFILFKKKKKKSIKQIDELINIIVNSKTTFFFIISNQHFSKYKKKLNYSLCSERSF